VIRRKRSPRLVMITADASEESKSPIQKERESVVERETAEHPSELETEVMIAADASEEIKTSCFAYA
jgi:hypothetical protein